MPAPERPGGQPAQRAATVRIRPATPGDLRAILALERASPTAARWGTALYEELLRAPASGRVALVAEQASGEADVIAFLVARQVEREWEVENIAVNESSRRQGVGSLLLGAFLDLARRSASEAIFLEVRESNHAARALYEKWRFVLSGRRPAYYSAPQEDALVYRLSFPAALSKNG